MSKFTPEDLARRDFTHSVFPGCYADMNQTRQGWTTSIRDKDGELIAMGSCYADAYNNVAVVASLVPMGGEPVVAPKKSTPGTGHPMLTGVLVAAAVSMIGLVGLVEIVGYVLRLVRGNPSGFALLSALALIVVCGLSHKDRKESR